jgi:hypothetical protein
MIHLALVLPSPFHSASASAHCTLSRLNARNPSKNVETVRPD